MMWDGMWGWHWFGGVAMILLWLLIVLLLAAVLKYLRTDDGRDRTAAERGKTATDYLDEAYARGEITRDEYLIKRADIQRR